MENLNTGFKSFLDKKVEEKRQLEQELEKIPFECQEISQFELLKIIEVRKKLEQLIEAYDAAIAKGIDSKTKQDYFEQVLKHLDQFTTLWNSKFTTGDIDDTDSQNYSVYYVTKSGVSLRMKRANLEKRGLKDVTQPFMEKIFFSIPEDQTLSEKPVVGGIVEEYLSPEFLELQKQDEVTAPFESKIRKYMKDGKIVAIKNVDNGLDHFGHEVNNIVYDNRQS